MCVKLLRLIFALCFLNAVLFLTQTSSALELVTSFDVPLESSYTAVSRATNSLDIIPDSSSYTFTKLVNKSGNKIGYRINGLVVDQPYTFTIQSLNEDVTKVEINIGLLDNSYANNNATADMMYRPPNATLEANENGDLILDLNYTFRMCETYAILIYPLT